MADKDGFNKIAEWLLKDEDIKVAVLSAGGKTQNCAKVTDLIYSAWSKIANGESVTKSLQPFYARLKSDASRLGLLNFIEEELMTVEQEVEKDFSLDFLLSRGEYFYAKLFSAFSGLPFVDSKNLIGFYDDGKLNLGYSEFKIKDTYERVGRFVTGGFYGSYRNGKIKTFTRGGSDFSGAIITKGLCGEEYLNFTDVDGVFSIDPKLAKGEIIKEMSFDTVRLLGEFGAGVLHPASVLPLYGSGAQIRLKNTFNKKAQGTLIKEDCLVTPFATALKRGCCVVKGKDRESGYKAIRALGETGVKIIHSASSADFFQACFFGEENPLKNTVSSILKRASFESGLSFFYLTKTKRAFEVYHRLKKLKILVFASDFENGIYLTVKEKDEKIVLQTLNEV